MYLCGFVCLNVCCRGQEGWTYYEVMLATNEILASKHDIAALKVKQGHFETTILVLRYFVVFYYG